jgi:hypothetical protein
VSVNEVSEAEIEPKSWCDYGKRSAYLKAHHALANTNPKQTPQYEMTLARLSLCSIGFRLVNWAVVNHSEDDVGHLVLRMKVEEPRRPPPLLTALSPPVTASFSLFASCEIPSLTRIALSCIIAARCASYNRYRDHAQTRLRC